MMNLLLKLCRCSQERYLAHHALGGWEFKGTAAFRLGCNMEDFAHSPMQVEGTVKRPLAQPSPDSEESLLPI